MIVFKSYLKILKQNSIAIIIYLSIFIGIAVIMMSSFQGDPLSFSYVKTDVVFIDHDQTELTNDLKEYLSQYANFKTIETSQLDDAFFYRDVEVIVEIPKGFTEAFSSDDPQLIAIKEVPDSATSHTFTANLQRYLTVADIYLRNDIETENLQETIESVLIQGAKTTIPTVQQNDFESMHYFYNYLAYIILALILSVMGSIMAAFKPLEIKRRNQISSLSNRKVNGILILGNLLLGLFLLFILVILSGILYGFGSLIEPQGLLFILNAFVFTLSTIALAYLVVTVFNSPHIINALGTVLSLGFSFITGIFIPQQLLGGTLLQFSRLIPSYWYINTSNRIGSIHTMNWNNLQPIISRMGMQLAFTILFLILSLIISKAKQRSEE